MLLNLLEDDFSPMTPEHIVSHVCHCFISLLSAANICTFSFQKESVKKTLQNADETLMDVFLLILTSTCGQ